MTGRWTGPVLVLALALAVGGAFADTRHAEAWEAYDAGDYETAREIWRPLAEDGDIDAQVNLGLLHDVGPEGVRDDAAAARWYREAAEQGDSRAQFMLGTLYYQGRGVEQDDGAAAHWYREAAEQGVPEAQYSLGVLHAQGWGVEQDDVRAYALMRAAAEQGHRPAESDLERLEERMSEEELSEARERAAAWLPD